MKISFFVSGPGSGGGENDSGDEEEQEEFEPSVEMMINDFDDDRTMEEEEALAEEEAGADTGEQGPFPMFCLLSLVLLKELWPFHTFHFSPYFVFFLLAFLNVCSMIF